jgi:hypothetical protein
MENNLGPTCNSDNVFSSRLAVAERAPNTFCHLCVAFPLSALLIPLPYLLCFHYQPEEDPGRTHARWSPRLVSVVALAIQGLAISVPTVATERGLFPPFSSPFLVFSRDVAFSFRPTRAWPQGTRRFGGMGSRLTPSPWLAGWLAGRRVAAGGGGDWASFVAKYTDGL